MQIYVLFALGLGDCMLSEIVKINGILIVFVCLLLSSFLLFARSPNRLANIFFAGFLSLLAIDVLGWVIADPSFSGSWLDVFRVTLGLLQMPLFLGFILTMLFGQFAWRWQRIFHTLPFLCALVLTLPGPQFGLSANTDLGSYLVGHEVALVLGMMNIQYYLYMAVAAFYLFQFRRAFQAHYSGAQSRTFQWLCCLVAVSLATSSLSNIKSFFSTPETETIFLALQLTASFTTLGVVSGFTLTALLMPEIFRSVDRKLMRVAAHLADASDSKEESQLKLSIISLMQQHKPFLRQDLTLQQLADLLKISPHKLSATINTEFSETFFNFVNRYRITYAQEILLSNPSRGITEIFYDAGFSSKSSFNTAFRKNTGNTPSAYRKSHLKRM